MIGFRTASSMVVSLDGRTPIAFLDNPFPNGFNLPPGTSLGAATNLGLGLGESVIIDSASPYIQQWNLNVQRELPGDIVFEAAYIGSKGTRLLAGERHHAIAMPLVPEPGDAVAEPGPEPVLRDHHQPVLAAAQPAVARGQLLRPFRSITASTRPASRSILDLSRRDVEGRQTILERHELLRRLHLEQAD